MSGRKKRRRMIDHRTPEEKAAQEERHRALVRMYERAKIELETGKRPPPGLTPTT
jgi:hypothetical protein